MKLSTAAAAVLIVALGSASAFVPLQISQSRSPTFLQGYLDDLGKIGAEPDPNPDIEAESKEVTNMKKEDVDRYGAGSWEGFVDFDEFDGGDGQMGVAGDGNKSLEKFDFSELAKSKSMSAKNAWGRSTGYADTLIDQGVDTQRAQQLENWKNQQEILQQRKQQRYMTEQFDQVSEDENWRELAKFGVERNQDFDLNDTFGAVTPGNNIDGVIELNARVGGAAAVSEFSLKNEYMGFADFRAAFTPETGPGWSVEPTEGSLAQKSPTNFLVRFKSDSPGVCEGFLVIETEDFKKTFKLVGSTS